jgi:hypothetical protein
LHFPEVTGKKLFTNTYYVLYSHNGLKTVPIYPVAATGISDYLYWLNLIIAEGD